MNLTSSFHIPCARPPEENLGRIPESLHELMKPENRHFLDELHEEAWEVRWSRLGGWRLMLSFAIFCWGNEGKSTWKAFFFLQAKATTWKVDSLEGRNPTFEEWGCGYGQWGHTFNVAV